MALSDISEWTGSPRCRVGLAAIGSAQGGLTLMPEGTADLSMEDYAALALRLISRSTKQHPSHSTNSAPKGIFLLLFYVELHP